MFFRYEASHLRGHGIAGSKRKERMPVVVPQLAAPGCIVPRSVDCERSRNLICAEDRKLRAELFED
jgi:hypothetical protein